MFTGAVDWELYQGSLRRTSSRRKQDTLEYVIASAAQAKIDDSYQGRLPGTVASLERGYGMMMGGVLAAAGGAEDTEKAATTSTIKSHMTANDLLRMIKLSLLLVLTFSARSHAFVAQNRRAGACQSLAAVPSDSQDHATRRDVIYKSLTAGIVTFGGAGLFPSVALAKDAKKALSEDYRQGTAALGQDDSTAVLPKEAYKKLPSGLIYADLRVGSGEEAKVGSKATLQWVLRKSNGYFVDSSDVAGVPFIFKIGDPNGAIVGVDEGIRGMRMGGTRRLLIPVNQGYVQGLDDDKPGPMPQGFGPRQQMRRVQGVRKDVPGEYIFIEVQLTRVR
eukprot:scaffold19837_cov46-Attheya_sp.AAC.1